MKIKFESLVTDELFVSKVQSGGLEAEIFIDNLLEKYPEEKEEILFAVQFLIVVNDSRIKWKGIETVPLRENIRQKRSNKKPFISIYHRNVYSVVLRVAAIVTIVIGFSYYFHKEYSSNLFERTVQNVNIPTNETVIILSDGTQHTIEKNESCISYSKEGKEVLITESDEKVKKIENPKDNKKVSLNQIIVPYGRRHKVVLSDGTLVQLNSGSKLVFPASFNKNLREVYLDGEGYFEVAKNPDKPFVVNTNYIDIKVTGTVFNVTSYSDEPVISTVLVEGSVQVLQKNKTFGNVKYDLASGHGCFYSVSSQESSISEVDVKDYIGWKDGWIKFKDQSLKDIARKVEKYYNKTIVIEGEELANALISGKLILSDDFEDVLSNITKTLKGTYKIDNRDIYVIEYIKN